MARINSKTQLEALRQKQLALVTKIREAEAKAKKAEREKDDRRKLLAGAVALKELEVNHAGDFATALLSLLDQGLKGAADRALFGPTLAKEPRPEPKAQSAPAPFLMAAGGTMDGGGSEVGNG